jgi:hypothetical protein
MPRKSTRSSSISDLYLPFPKVRWGRLAAKLTQRGHAEMTKFDPAEILPTVSNALSLYPPSRQVSCQSDKPLTYRE